MNNGRRHIPEGIRETKRKIKEKKDDIEERAAAEASPGAGGEGGPSF